MKMNTDSNVATDDSKKKGRRPGSGRTKGAYSFVKLTVQDLLDKFKDPKQTIVVGRVWAETCGFDVTATTSAADINEKIQGLTPTTKIGATVVELD